LNVVRKQPSTQQSSGKRVEYVLRQYPQVTETYIETEIRAAWECHDVDIVALNVATEPSRDHHPFCCVGGNDEQAAIKVASEFKPDVVHGHELDNARMLSRVARALGLPFTVRAHSYDVLGLGPERLSVIADVLNADDCLGCLAFPFARPMLTSAGVSDDKIHDCFPVLDYGRFYDTSPNGDGIMNVGACQPKKQMDDFLSLARSMPGCQFDLFAVGFEIDSLRPRNWELGSPVKFMPRLDHRDMPAAYKQHQWLVYTASPAVGTVGWPVAVAEAQASGVGVCMRHIRPDLRDYLGNAGFLFDRLEEVREIVSQPVPTSVREKGFLQARKSDIRRHLSILGRLWAQA
jgi:hypothetical protein